MEILSEVLRRRSTMPDVVRFGDLVIHLFNAGALASEQTGYSVDPAGSRLDGDAPGQWRPTWIVIGHLDGSGDPVFVDTADEKGAVYTAPHGQGAWRPRQLASSSDAFFDGLSSVPTPPAELSSGTPLSSDTSLWGLLEGIKRST